MSSSSARWTNSTCISESTSTNPANGQTTGSSTMLNPTAPTSASPLTSSGIIVINSTTTSAGSLLTSSGSSSDPTPVTPITVSGITPSDTTCVETPTGSSFHYFPNSTIHEVTPTPLPGGSGSGYLSTGVPFPFPSSALNHTFSKSTSTFGSPISTSSNSDPSCTSAPAIDSTVENGDFETGLSPWSVDLVDIVSTSYKVTGPGADGSCGAFRVDMRRNLQTDDLRANLRLVSPLIAPPQPPGSKWVVSFWVRFGTGSFTNFTENYDASDGSYVNLYANGAVAHRVDATSVDTGGNWTHVKVPYLTASNERMLQLVFSFALGDKAETNEVWIDRVAMDAVTETSSTAVGPVSAGVTSKPVVAQG
ncbi:uncharacterized protein F4822DRAFT_114150 [Hypoxylon trugodes]|uniref:uncharacterized protein n=1 Tax=Hypoxylon trugodes TaxID=326681 RepID=UPI00219D7272|nr:uncharacterized protein F4822DRAFT_114150 [Hypoxylon trugodes]KAI1392038.1 hypothetical protein F4822DRAFT_114150 [Hypoxylon trugodes]